MSKNAQEIVKLLGCEYEIFEGLADDDVMMDAYFKALEDGKRQNFTPIFIRADDALLESIKENLNGADVKTFAANALSKPLPDLKSEYDENFSELEGDAEAIGKIKNDDPKPDQLLSIWDYDTQLTKEIILAKIPVKHPWEVFAYLPFGGFNDCPDELTMMAAAKTWYERYGALPCAISGDELEFVLEKPLNLSDEEAVRLASEHYFFCIDRIEQCSDEGTIGGLACELKTQKFWYFWWD
ncbi:MAG: DUF4253 domain-containing protein [Campylobacter sp.]|nr:DUF4253 domain-containing protein [Campylobacter sp.]